MIAVTVSFSYAVHSPSLFLMFVRLGFQHVTAVPVKFETAQREIESSADRNATRVTCYTGKCRELAMHLAGQPLELSVSFKLRFGRLQPSLDTEIEQISTKIRQTLLLVL